MQNDRLKDASIMVLAAMCGLSAEQSQDELVVITAAIDKILELEMRLYVIEHKTEELSKTVKMRSRTIQWPEF
jgi:hypothetical protein